MNKSLLLKDYSDIYKNNELSINNKCGHVMELKKMKQWIENHNTCPICFIKSSLDDVIKIYHSNALNERYSQYYKEKYEEALQKEMERLNIQDENQEKSSSKIENILDELEYEVECKKNRSLEKLLYKNIENGSDFINQNTIEDMIQIEMKTKDEMINILKIRLFETQINNKLNQKNIDEENKYNGLINKIKEKEEDKNKYLSKLSLLQENFNKMEKDNLNLKEKLLYLDKSKELENIYNNQIELIAKLTKENEELEKENKDNNKIINKINQKYDKKFRDLESQYQELKLITELLEYKIQTFDDIEKNLYEFDKEICMLLSRIMPPKSLSKEPFRTFLKEPQKLSCNVWKRVSKLIYTGYGKIINDIGDDINIVKNIIQNDIPIPLDLIEEIQIVQKHFNQIDSKVD